MTAKVPYPRQLTSNETLDTLTHWKSHVRNYFRRDDSMKEFFSRTSTWNPSRPNYGFTGDEADIKADSLESLLDTISGFLPGPYLTAQITKQTKCIDDVFKLIWKHYDVDPTPSTFLDFDLICLEKEERYIDMYYRMIYHAEQHLVLQGTNIEGETVAESEVITHSHKNLITLNWLSKINSNLVNIVKLEKSNDLKNGKQLHSLVHEIAKNVDEWLRRHGIDEKKTNSDSQVRNMRWDGNYSPRGTARGRGYSRAKSQPANFRSGPNKFCPGCNYLSKELSLNVDFSHFPSQCPRKKSVLRLLKIEESHMEDSISQEDVTGEEDQEEDQTQHEGKNISSFDQKSQVRKIWKSKSPTLKAFIEKKEVSAIIDEGSEISAINDKVQLKCNIPISRTVENARAAGSHNLPIIGETTKDVILTVPTTHDQTKWNLGQCIVVENLGCDVLIGEPAKLHNNITTHPTLQQATSIGQDCIKNIVPYSNDDMPSVSCINNVASSVTVYPKQKVHVQIPSQLQDCNQLLVESTEQHFFPEPAIYDVKNGKISLTNNNDFAVNLNKETPLFFTSLRKIYDISNESMKQYEYSPHITIENCTLDDVKIDPDNMLSPEWGSIFKNVLTDFRQTITNVPGRYNGYYGQVPCSLTLTGTLPPSVKPRLPNYNDEKLKVMADIMDKMEMWGVLAKPETIGVIPTHIHPCILVPKDNDSFRLVTDFRSIQNKILQLPTVMPTVAEAMKNLATANFHIELDFTNYYWQMAIPREDSEKLAIMHPYSGIRVYTVLPQGLRNSAEWGSEVLARIYGDMVGEKKVTRIADQLYILGDSLVELNENFKEVLNRARNAGLTFKPSKIVICPKSTIILGWQKINNDWFPTNHVLSPLSQAEPPSTVKKLRGWLGAYRQIAKTIPNYSSYIQIFEKLVGGKNSRDRIVWSPELLKKFDMAKDSIATAKPICFPRPTDTLQIFSDWSQDADAVGGRLVIQRNSKGNKISLNGGEFSCRLKGAQNKWTPCEKESLAIKLLVQHFQPFIRENQNVTTVFTDNIVTVHAFNAIQTGKISSSVRVASFISTLCENNVQIAHIPGTKTPSADYNSRHPSICNDVKCQICIFVGKEVDTHDVFKITDIQTSPLHQRNAWLNLQKQDPTHITLHKLITSGQAPEKKSRDKSAKLLHNLYKRGLLFIAKDGLIQVKHPDLVHDINYNAISIPEKYCSSLVQSIHLKLNHPSAYQLNKVMARQFYCPGMPAIINEITANCNTCVRLKTLPKEVRDFSTTPTECFGKHFSADVLIEKGQKILVCREKLSQMTLTKIILDETAETMEAALVALISDYVPDTGCTVQVDAATGFQALADGKSKYLGKLNILIDIGRVNNKNKNPVAENAIKEVRKEWLRFKPSGDLLNETELAIITSTINSRVRQNGLAPKEMMLKRSLHDHKPITIDDSNESSMQYDRRTLANEKIAFKDKLTLNKKTHAVNVGDLVFLKTDLSKSKARDEFIVIKKFSKNNEFWLLIRKSQKQFRNKDYLVKESEVILAPNNVIEKSSILDNDDSEEFCGFHENLSLDKRNRLKSAISALEQSVGTVKNKGRPKSLYPDYLQPLENDVLVSENDERLCGFSENELNLSIKKSQDLQKIIQSLEENNDEILLDLDSDNETNSCHGFEDSEVEILSEKLKKMKEVKIMSVDSQLSQNKHAWIQQEWQDILDSDDFEMPVIKKEPENLSIHLPDFDAMNLSIDVYHEENNASLTFDDSEFLSCAEEEDTPVQKRSKSETDPFFIDYIPVLSSSESEPELECTRILNTSSPINWSPQKVKCDKVQNLNSVLDVIHETHQELHKPEEGKVYNMDSILEAVHNPCQAHTMTRRTKKKHDYKKANYKGFSEK